MNSIAETLKERDGRYGLFVNQAETAQRIKEAMFQGRPRADLAADQKEAFEPGVDSTFHMDRYLVPAFGS